MSGELYGYHRKRRLDTLGYVTFTQNKSTSARPIKMQTLVFMLPKDCIRKLLVLSDPLWPCYLAFFQVEP